MKVYVAQRPADDEIGDCRVTVEHEGRLYPLVHVELHSDAFEWGYAGSGPADLALSILADHFGEHPTLGELRRGECLCWRFHQDFKWRFIAPAPAEGFRLASYEIDDWLHEQADLQ